MTALRRKTKIRGAPMKALDLNFTCDQCSKQRAHGNHEKCSRARQLAMAELRAREEHHAHVRLQPGAPALYL